MRAFRTDRRGSAVKWFALSAAVLSLASVAGAHGLDWLSQSGRLALVAYHAPAAASARQVASDPGVDRMPTGSIPANALMIRIR